MIKFVSCSIAILFGLVVFQIEAQELPPIEVYTMQDYKAENQNWGISQSAEKSIYFANSKGLLEFNGAKWQLYLSPNETVMRSVNVIGDRIYTGCYMEFGYWQKDNLGKLLYTSLSKDLISPLIEDEQFWNIISLDDWILFQSLDRIYSFNTKDKSFNIIDSETTIIKMYKVNGSIYFQKINDGIYKIENGKEQLITNNTIAKNNVIVNIFPFNDSLLVQSQDDGFYVLTDGNLNRWNVAANEEIKKLSIYNSIQLEDGSFAIGTISKGLIQITKEGNLNYQINQSNGLSNNTVLSLFEDVENNIWLGLDNGINCLNVNSPFRVYNNDVGDLGTVYASAIHNGSLYLGTNQGLFYRKVNQNDSFSFIEGTQGQVWSLEILDELLFCGHNFGTFIVENGNAEKIANVQGTWGIKKIPKQPDLLLQGNYNGLNILERIGDNWIFKHKIEGFDISSRFFEIIDNEVFVSHEYKGVFKIKLNEDLSETLQVTRDSIKKGLNSSLTKYNQELLYAYKEGVFKYDFSNEKFIKDTILSKVYTPETYISGKLIADNKTNKLWSFSSLGLNYVTPGKLSTRPEINKIALRNDLRNGVTSYESILHLSDQKYLLGTSSGYISMNLEKLSEPSYQITINSISNNSIDKDPRLVDQMSDGSFKSHENNMGFTFSVPEVEKYLVTEYQYKLEGLYNHWSGWSTSSEAEFKNLPYGDYIFYVRGRVTDNLITNTSSYTFAIGRPWYLSNVMIAVYLLGLLLFSFIMHNIYKSYYKKQREKLILKKEKELELNELENKEQLMRMKNESLEKDIENKNRELAISTMSLIKKNEFLNNIKEELREDQNGQNLGKVIKIIDKNLNNTDDWKFFEEAFNNADKDFLKKVKTKHNSLTPNDLKLCAYLRLNLSSKEIAPLLNISTRSVEVKRYRLRKKMDLAHEASLTNYILEI